MKLTPPAPQHPTRRLKFFLEHPDWPKAEYWTKRLRRELSEKKFRVTHEQPVKEDVELMGQRTTVKHYIPKEKQPKKSLFSRFISKIKKPSQRGN